MKILLDAMGGDHAPEAVCEGAVLAIKKKLDFDGLVLIGNKSKINDELKKYRFKKDRLEIIDAPDVIRNDDSPVKAIRTKDRASLTVAMKNLVDGNGDVLISAGNTGALMAGGIFILGRIKNIDRPAIASPYPIFGQKKISLILDAGANAEIKPKNLLDFATMGSIYAEKVLGINSPKISLVNMGTEKSKGSAVLKTAYDLLEESKNNLGIINFAGNIEARDIPLGTTDVLICDGFVGNVIIKLTEGLGWNIMKILKEKLSDGVAAKIGALFLIKKLSSIKNEADYTEYGGAPILGVSKPLIKAHGSSNGKAFCSAIKSSIHYVNSNTISVIEDKIAEIEKFNIMEG
ncbi:MAG: phosphate acyltransferase PlsX [Clostridiales Family XIII bacterium]|jgi:glycerol-3-phosphate acyltransferase PlsX|nr:phosphate acyltransferase PlsX [Clostridiales Family XIII bacterium]